MRILVFSASIGHGHNQVARAIQEEAVLRGHSAQIVDVLEFVSPFLSRVVLEGYLRILRYTPLFYGRLYEFSEESASIEYSSIVNTLLCRGFQRLLKREKPAAIVCTHAFAVGLMTALKHRLKLDLPLFSVITDFTVHPNWVHDGVDRYIAASHKMLPLLQGLGVPSEMITPIGIPLRRQFSESVDKATARERIGVKDMPTILVMGGGLGLGLSYDLIQTIVASLPGHQVIVAAGQNRVLSREYERHGLPEGVTLLAYVEGMADYMAASDLLITKPGGVTCSEALCKHLPMVLVSPIPGQEHRNAAFLTDQIVAVQLDDTNMAERIADLMRDLERLSVMSRFAARLAKPQASVDFLDLIEEST